MIVWENTTVQRKYTDQTEFDLRVLLHFYEGLRAFDSESETIKAELARRTLEGGAYMPDKPTFAERGKLSGHWLPEDVTAFGFANAAECLKHVEEYYADAQQFIKALRDAGETGMAADREAYWEALIAEARETLGGM